MKRRDTSAMRERILEAADRLFYGQGIHAIGVDTIAAEAGISKRTLYNHFPSKDELIVGYLQRRIHPIRVSGAPPADQILALFALMEKLFAQAGFRGCPFVNAVAEMGEPDHPARAVAVAFKDQQRDWFRDLLTQAKAPDPDGLAMQLMLLVDGAIATVLVRKEPAIAALAHAAARSLLSAAGIRSSG